jgi:tetratricopeptide (TPR) repeat protein
MSARLLVPVLLICLVACGAASAAAGPARPAAVRSEPLSSRALYQQTLRGTVLVGYINGKDGRAGTGFIIDAKRRLVVTNYHVAPEGACFVIFPMYQNGRVISDRVVYRLAARVPGRVIDSDPKRDLAIIQLESLPDDVAALKLAAENPQPGDRLHLVGNPGASAGLWVYTTGTVRQLVRRRVVYSGGQVLDTNVIESQMPINRGDSGSAVVNDRGEVVGVTSGAFFTSQVQNVGWHIDLNELKVFQADVIALQGDRSASAEQYERRALRLINKGKNALALVDLTRAIARDSKRGSAYRTRSRLNYLARRYDAALADGYRALDIDPQDGLAANHRGNAFAARGEYTRAIADFSLAIRRIPGDADIRINRGVCYAERKQFEEALKDFSEAIRLNPSNANAYAWRAAVHHARKEYKQATDNYLAALKLVPTSSALLARLGHVYRESGQPALAVESYEKALKLGVASPAVVWRSLGHARFNLKRYEQAILAYNEAIKGNPGDAHAWFGRGAAREEQGEVDEAQADYARAVELNPAYASSLTTYATRAIRVTNATGEPIKVYGQFQTQTTDGWRRLPQTGSWVWELAPGASLLLLDDRSTAVEAGKCRLWAVGTKTGKRFDNMKKSTLLLVETPYKARKKDTYEHRFGG